jgi:hypothetical protein
MATWGPSAGVNPGLTSWNPNDARPLVERIRDIAESPHPWIPGVAAGPLMREVVAALEEAAR